MTTIRAVHSALFRLPRQSLMTVPDCRWSLADPAQPSLQRHQRRQRCFYYWARAAFFARKMLAAQQPLGKVAPHPLVNMRPKRLDQVGGQRLAPAFRDVQKAEQRVEADDLHLPHGLVMQKGVAERQADIDRVGRQAKCIATCAKARSYSAAASPLKLSPSGTPPSCFLSSHSRVRSPPPDGWIQGSQTTQLSQFPRRPRRSLKGHIRSFDS
jgi:hypothetical protein